MHDSQIFTELLAENSSKDVWADSAYRSDANEINLYALGYRSQIHHKGKRNKPLTEKQQASNKRKSRIRVRVEHVFGSMENEQGGMVIRTIGLVRAATKIGLMNMGYNIRRATTLLRVSASAI